MRLHIHFFGFLAWATLASTNFADHPRAANPVYLPGGTADPSGKTGYVASATGGIDALDLETGALLWETRDARRPLLAWEGRLAAWAPIAGKGHQLRVVLLDSTRKGKKMMHADLVFPDWVAVEPELGQTFAAEAMIVQGTLLVRWEAHARYAGGAAPTPEILEAAKKDAGGVARIDLDSGKVEMLEAGKTPVPARPVLPAKLDKAVSRQYWTGADWLTRPLVAGNTVAALVQEALPNQLQKLTLRRWDLTTRQELENAVLLQGKELWPQVQPDGRYLFVHQALVKEQLPAGDYAWWIFSLETGKQVGKLPYEPGAQLAVLGPRAFFLVAGQARRPPAPGFAQDDPRVLKAFDLKTGEKIWERPVEPQRRFLPPP